MKHDQKMPFVLTQYIESFYTMQEGCVWYANNLRFWVQLRKTKEFDDIIDEDFKTTMLTKYDSDRNDAVLTINQVINDFGWNRPLVKKVPDTLAELILLLDEANAYMLWLINSIEKLPSIQPKEIQL